MTTSTMKLRHSIAACLMVSILSACGESDLVEIHEEVLDDAIATEQEPDVSPANPVTEAVTSADFDLSTYTLVFNDEFDGQAIDASKWDTSLWTPGTVVYDQQQHYVDIQSSENTLPSPFSFDGNSLTISATATADNERAAANEQPYLSGILTSRSLFDITFGYVEARVKLEAGRGLWPSLWMLGSDSEGIRPEVYIFEHDGSKPDSLFHNYNYVDTNFNLRSHGQQEVQLDGLSDGFHTVGLHWTAGELLYYIDGRPTYRIIGENVPQEDMYLILNLAMGGVWPGSTDATTPDPASIQVDYVRVYELPAQ